MFRLQPGLKWKLWIISNYEYERGSKTAINRIVSYSKSEKENSADAGISLKELGVTGQDVVGRSNLGCAWTRFQPTNQSEG